MKLFLLSLLLASYRVNAQTVVEETSFGYGGPRAPDSTQLHGWKMLGEGHDVQLMSDKVILTPPYPGNKRGGLWAEHTTALEEWTADFEFRASGGERAGGNLQLWYANNGEQSIGMSSIYTVGKFDGLAIVIDSHGGGAGSIRGFLNDGSTDYQSRHPAVDALAFGHCDYSYRNLGRPSRLQLKQSRANFEVRIDDRVCFSSNKIALPPNYSFGITGATSEDPDSFEVFKFVVTSGARSSLRQPDEQQQQQQQQQSQANAIPISAPATPGDVPASSITSNDAQFADLHNRLQGLNGITNALFREFQSFREAQGMRHGELLSSTPKQQTIDISGLDKRIQNLELLVTGLKKDIAGADQSKALKRIEDKLSQTHLGITEHLPTAFTQAITTSAPRTGFLFTMVIMFQVLLAVAYVLYKRRRANSPKKLL